MLDNVGETGARPAGRHGPFPLRDGERTGVRLIDTDGRRDVHCRYVVDASGPQAVLGRQPTERTYDAKMRQVAYYGYYEGVKGRKAIAPPRAIEANKYGWFWASRRREAAASSARPPWARERRSSATRSADGHGGLTSCARQCPTCSRSGERRANHPPKAISDWAYTSKKTAGPGWYLAETRPASTRSSRAAARWRCLPATRPASASIRR